MAKHCTACGSPLIDGTKFCGKCGSQVQMAPQQQPTQPQYQQPVQQQYQQPQQPIQQNTYDQQFNQPKKKNFGLIAVVAVIVLVIGFFAFRAFMQWYDPVHGDPVANTSQNQSANQDVFSQTESNNSKGESVPDKFYGGYEGGATVRLMDEDETLVNPFANITTSQVYIAGDILYFDFYEPGFEDEGVYYEFTDFYYDQENDRIKALDEYEADGSEFTVFFEGLVEESAGQPKMIKGNVQYMIKDLNDPNMSIDFYMSYYGELVFETTGNSEATDNPGVVANSGVENLIGRWELTSHPLNWSSEVWTFKNNYELIDSYGSLLGNWSYIDEQTLVIHYNNGKDVVFELYLNKSIMVLTDEEDYHYTFFKEGMMPVDGEMTAMLEDNWDYLAAYPSNGYSNLQASTEMGYWQVDIDGQLIEMPVGYIRFDDTTYNPPFGYCMYSLYEGELIVNFDPSYDGMFMEYYIVVQ